MRREAKNYFIYTRKSEEFEDRQTQSIDDQIRICKEMAKKRNWSIAGIFQEARSARKADKRPVFAEMVQKIENGEADGILSWKTNRLARNLKEGGYIFDLLRAGIIKHIKTSETDWFEDADVLSFALELGLSSKYSDDVSKDVLRGMESKRLKGEFPHMAGKGYVNKDGKIVPDTEDNRFGILQECWKLLLYENNSISQIRNKVNIEWGFRTRKTKRNGGKKISNARLYEMFSNPFYKGQYSFNGKTYKLNHMPMVTIEEWDLAQIILGRKNRPRRKNHNFAYRGPIICGECGCMVTAEVKTKPIKSTREIKVYPPYYHCTKRKGNCSQSKKYIREDELEQLIKDEISRFTILPQFRDWALEVLRESHKNEVSERKEIFNNLQKTYQDIENQINRLTDMRLKDQLTDNEYNVKRGELLADKSKIKDSIDNYDHRVDQWFALAEKSFNFISCAREAFEIGGLDTKKAILAALGRKITLLDGKIYIEPEEWLVPIADKYPALEKQYKMFEPENNTDIEHKNRILEPIRTAWLGREDSNRN
jgi:DNA invertase Pin-like site-specific DNA recombinase